MPADVKRSHPLDVFASAIFSFDAEDAKDVKCLIDKKKIGSKLSVVPY